MDIVFYELMVTSVEKALPKLVEKIYEKGLRTHIYCPDDVVLKILNDCLWTYAQLGFLPHGTVLDPIHRHAENPIWLSLSLDFVNTPDTLISLVPKQIDFKGKLIYFYDKNTDVSAFKFLQNPKSVIWNQDIEGGWKRRV